MQNNSRTSLAGLATAIAAACVALSMCVLIGRSIAMTGPRPFPKADGYRGIWYSNQPSGDEYRYKYSGGLGTYCANHLPMAYYSAEANKTFFAYGGSKELGAGDVLLAMVSYYDHAAGLVPKPTIVMEMSTDDAHHNPTITLDENGYIWLFVSAHGGKDGFVYRSREPYSIDSFEHIAQQEFTYPQPWYISGFGFLFLFAKYTAGRELYSRSSADGIEWTEDRKHAGFGGHYQVSCRHGNKIGTAFMYHPPIGGLNARTNLYYIETADCGKTWRTTGGEPVDLPLRTAQNKALVHDYEAEGLLVYINDLNFDQRGNPVVLYVLSKGYESGPKNGPRLWTTARWTGQQWEVRPIACSDHNYDMGSLYVEPDGTWRVVGPTEPGPQPYCTGGEVVMWTSADQGKTWKKARLVTRNSTYNHTYVRRPVKAHPDFYALWADGNPLEPSESRLYFANKSGAQVRMLPFTMTNDFDRPHPLRR